MTVEHVRQIRGAAIAMPISNIDTDMIIPAQFLRTVSRHGLGKYAFYNLRYDLSGSPLPDSVLNRSSSAGAKFIIARENFGCGSSREHAVWALLDLGVRCVVSPSFGDIFAINASHNGLLLISVPPEVIEKLLTEATLGANAVFTVDIDEREMITPVGGSIPFELDPFLSRALISGTDDEVFHAEWADRVRSFEERTSMERPWMRQSVR